MATRLYLHAAAFDTGTYPGSYPDTTGELQHASPAPAPSTGWSGTDAVTVHKSMNKTKGSSETSFAITRSGSGGTQNGYVTKFISDPLDNVTSISANTWSSMSAKRESSLNANFAGYIFALYVWRPSTNSLVGIIDSWRGEGGFGEPAAANSTRLSKGAWGVAGAAVSGVQDGDVLILECYNRYTPANTSSYTMTWYYDGTNEYNSGSNGDVVSDVAAYIETPQDLTFVTDIPPEPIQMTNASRKKVYDLGLIKKV